ncbi:MAG: tRNA uridine-5-carboxymethylaminomethyl(34) synthesis GTPase MnmE [Oscillospiraceae bacterium]|nr:tRNA uridine-5-carboxymethylaminomethyl(34) synthesis GTPase MnmE [Oscillospiraceae bacterium]
MTDTIAAIATGSGVSAIGIIRISGAKAIEYAASVFHAVDGTALEEAEDKRVYYGRLTGADGELLDLCLCFVSRAPRSYTGEDTAELQCHGSPIALTGVLRALFALGARQAEPGEFSKRAFLNGRIDITQAEAIVDLIEAETPAAARNAAGQLNGAISSRLERMYKDILDVMAHFHAAIDYPDEDIDEFEMQVYIYMLQDARDELEFMLSTHERGKILREGVPTAIVGRPNTGKSSLLNALVGYDRAIVTQTPGTTRDTIEEKIVIGGVPLRITDTAGIRKTADTVEMLGVERSLSALRGAGLVILVLDGSQPLADEDYEIARAIPRETPVVIAVNKSDLPPALNPGDISSLGSAPGTASCRISALTGEGVDGLCLEAAKLLPLTPAMPDGGLITNARQAGAIMRGRDALNRAIGAINASVTPDAVLADVEEALGAIGETTGKTLREDMIDRIFERFCVGK